MKYYRLLIVLFFITNSGSSQKLKNEWKNLKTDTFVYKPYWDYAVYVGFGLSTKLKDFPSTVYYESGSNFQIGLLVENSVTKRISLITAIEYNYLKFNADAAIKINGNKVEFQSAPDSIKYASLHYQLIQIPLHVRYYLFSNYKKKPDIFIESGITVSHRFSLSKNQSGLTYHYRLNGKSNSFSLNSYAPTFPIWFDFIIGFKGNALPSLNLLSSSTIGFSMQLNSLFKKTTNALNPYYFTWKFML